MNNSISDTIANFDSLPDAAYVRLPVVQTLFACSGTTLWRMTKAGVVPKPVKIFSRAAAWNVGELRTALSALRTKETVI